MVETPSEVKKVLQVKSLNPLLKAFDDLVERVVEGKNELAVLQKEVAEAREVWEKEKKDHERFLAEKMVGEELERQRKKEAYEYELTMVHKKAADEFTERKAKWERELSGRKEEIESEKRELAELRKTVAGFEVEEERAVKMACVGLEKELTQRFETEKNLREQEVKSEREILGLKIANLQEEKLRLGKELEALKKSLDESVRQLKEIAVKVIETGGSAAKLYPEAKSDQTS